MLDLRIFNLTNMDSPCITLKDKEDNEDSPFDSLHCKTKYQKSCSSLNPSLPHKLHDLLSEKKKKKKKGNQCSQRK